MLNTIRMGEWFQIFVPKEWENITIDHLFRHVWEAPKKLIHTFRMEKKVQINGKEANWTLPLKAGSKLQIRLFEEEEIQLTPWFQSIDILFEDDHVLVLNKPPFINTHPNDRETDTNTLMNAVAFYLLSKGEIRNIRQIHRLDRDTSGAILFAKHPLAGAVFDKLLEKRKIKRTYLALTHGLFQNKKGSIDAPIGRDRHHSTRRRVSPTGQPAITHYQVVKEDKQQNHSYVKCWLETGRTHQIRVHLSHIGNPLIGDVLYGGKPIVKRQALHAVKLEFLHPFTLEKIVCHAPFLDENPIFKGINIYDV
ncbi:MULTISPECIES: RluA family pseudouridine synthase [Neobacillus]|jgi:23S rRNA pseudouridine1911/1915/1917 synthase|uniref:Pseudouridine synthase n=1 Tax=Neobacillus sedimentimangrovi TaxID=2699460 RepID=A0ABS8QLK4_9BACI|nr:RluA family pseudouridine synthase [Neobacillus sedimentimangrovi]AIM17322.1 pseudouridine synthase [Bacillus sp. X1(2014)]MCD4840167.1 RluA family pseudouridine synthase [Neobacillus sedimentimangrovi]